MRYDGTAFVALEVPSETPPTNFWQVLLHGDAVIGLSPDAGVVVHGPSSSALYQAEHGLLNNDVVGGTLDTEGNLWVGHWVGGWSRISTSGISTWNDVGLAAEHQQRFFKPGGARDRTGPKDVLLVLIECAIRQWAGFLKPTTTRIKARRSGIWNLKKSASTIRAEARGGRRRQQIVIGIEIGIVILIDILP